MGIPPHRMLPPRLSSSAMTLPMPHSWGPALGKAPLHHHRVNCQSLSPVRINLKTAVGCAGGCLHRDWVPDHLHTLAVPKQTVDLSSAYHCGLISTITWQRAIENHPSLDTGKGGFVTSVMDGTGPRRLHAGSSKDPHLASPAR